MKRTSEPKLNQSLKGGEQQKVNPYTMRRLRQKVAEIKRPKVRAGAVAGFLLMPQFRSCLVGISHLYPVLVRLVAVLFAECTLISPAHPALSLKASDTKASYSFKKLFGDAWFTLKTSRATTFQWSMFGAVVLMVTTLLTALGAFFGRIMLGVGSVAQAQMFTIFQNPNDPYGTAGDPASWTSTAIGTAGISQPAAGTMFDQRVYAPATGTNNGISADYALMVLDKVLRQSMADTPNGGLMQNALRDLMVIYNSGMLVIACVMIGWMVISLIIDTAKTGTVGGGRHNMVWLPIRILFALGIMFPLGSVGFSGGQYMVVKLAEWGSNFGTRGWTTYVSAVVGNQTLLAPYSVKNAGSIATSITKIMVCQVAYNTYLRQRTGLLDPSQIITRYRDAPGASGKPYLTNRYTNTTNPNVCGTINYGSNLVPDDQSAQMNWDPSVAGSTTPMSVSTNRASQPDNVYKNTALATAAKAYRTAMRAAVESQVEEVLGGDGNGAARIGPAITAARNFACQFVANHTQNGDAATTTNNPVADIGVADAAGNPAAVPECAGMAKIAADPSTAVLAGIQTGLMTAMMTAFTGTGQPALQTYIGTGTGSGVAAPYPSTAAPPAGGSPMLTEMSIRGWGGMGTWYQDIVTLNSIMLSVREPFVTIDAGAAWAGDAGTVMEDQCAHGATPGEPCKYPEIAASVLGMMSEYDRWWGVSSMVTDVGKGPVAGAAQSNTEMGNVPGTMAEGAISAATTQSSGDTGVLDTFARLLFPRSTDTFIFKAVDMQATNTYPLTQLADTGHSMLGIGVALWGTISLFQAVSTIESPWFSVGKGLAFSAVMQMLASLGSIMIFTGILVSFYLPALPYLRVAFAVLTWITAVFEAVVMVPVAALTHLSTTGPGLMGQHGRIAWVMWFSIFMRPILVVFGFIGGMLVFNTFAVYFHTTFSQGAGIIINQPGLMSAYIAKICYSVVYLATLYSVANSTFKFMDILPNQMMRWMGEWGSRGGVAQSMDPGPVGRGLGFAGAQFMEQMKQAIPGKYIQSFKENSIDWPDRYGNTRHSASMDRAALLSTPASALDALGIKQRAADTMLTLSRLSGKDREMYQSLSQRDQDRFIVDSFIKQEDKLYKRFSFEKGVGTGIMARLGGGTFGGDFRALDGVGGIGAGQVAGAVVADQALQKALSAGNSTHTSDWDELSDVQRDNVRKKIESQMSAADLSMYAKMDSAAKNEFVQSFYLTDPLAFAPGVGKSGVDKMTDFLMHPEKLKGDANAGNLAAAALLMKHMTRQEKDQATRRYLKWEKENGRPADPSLLLGQMGGMSVSDRMLDSALKFGGRAATHMVDDFRSNRLVTTAMKKLNFVTHAKDDIRRLSDAAGLVVGMYEMTAEERAFYDKATKEQKEAMERLKYEEYEARNQYNAGKGFFLLDSADQLERIVSRNKILMEMIMKDVAGGGLLLDNHKRAIAMMSGAEQVLHASLQAGKERQDFEDLMLKRRLLSKKFYKKQISASEYYKSMNALKRTIRQRYDIGF